MYFFLGLILAAFGLTFFLFLPYLGPLLIGLTFAIVFQPLHVRILRLIGEKKESLAALFTTLFVLIVIFVPLIFFVVRLITEAGDLYFNILNAEAGIDFIQRIANFVIDRFSPVLSGVSSENIVLVVRQYAAQGLSWLLRNIGSVFSEIARVIFSLFLSIFALYYSLKDGPKLRRLITIVSPLAREYDTEILDRLRKVVSSVVRGSLIIAVLQGIIAGIGYAFFGVPNPVLWGSITSLAAVIPAFGTMLVTIPAVLYLLIFGNITQAIGLLIWAGVLVGLVDNFLKPKLIERGVDIHPFLILLSVFGGIEFFGPIGFLLGPLILSFFLALLDIYQRQFSQYLEAES